MRLAAGTVLALGVLAFAVRGLAGPAAAADAEAPDYWRPAQQELAKLGDGFLVWETHRTGRWSIWTVKLDGTGLKQLSIEEADKDQMAPKISPDGKRIAYLSFPKTEAKQDGGGSTVNGQAVPLHVIGADGSGDKIVAPDARVYSGWDRAITWFNDNELAYISGDGNTYQLNTETGQQQLLIKRPNNDAPSWLPNSRKTFAVWSFGTFSPLNAKRQMVNSYPHMGGCQPYFTQDGEWGFWEAYYGGPFGVAHLRSWEATADRTLTRQIMTTEERALLPDHRDYIYFSMFSADKRLLTFAAMHHGAPGGYASPDWKVFAVQTDPMDMRVIGKPVRYTFDIGCDRFPDVWQPPLPLGFQSVKAPHTAIFPTVAGNNALWDFGDGSPALAGAGKHTYTKPGLYTVTATGGKEVLYGQVNVKEATPPKAPHAVLKNPREVVLVFDEPVNADAAKLSLKSQTKIEKVTSDVDGRVLRAVLAQPLKRADAISISGVTDRAQQPNTMATAELPIDVRIWPPNQDGLVFLWQGTAKPNLLRDPEKGERTCGLTLKGRAWGNRDHDLVLDGGLAVVEGLSPVFSKAIQTSKAFTIELCFFPARYDDQSRHCILSYGLLMENNKFLLRHKGQEIEMGRPQGGYLAITYQDGRLTAYQEDYLGMNAVSTLFSAKKVAETDKFPLDLQTFAAEPLMIGYNAEGQGWPICRGGPGLIVRGLAFYDRALTQDEITASYAARLAVDLASPQVEQIQQAGRLVAASKVPQPAEIAPYTRALAVNEYLCPDPATGYKENKRIRVAYWAMFDRQFEPLCQAATVTTGGLQDQLSGLTLFTDNPQLESEYLANTLANDPGVPLYFCPEPLRAHSQAARNWTVAGPFPASSSKTPADPNLAYKLAEQSWKNTELPVNGDLYLDLNPLFPDAKGTIACGRTCIKSPTDRQAIITVESGGGVNAWLNGRNVLSFQNDRLPLRQQKRAPVELKAGWNELVIEATKGGPWWGFIGDILGADGREMMDCERAPSLPKIEKPGEK